MGDASTRTLQELQEVCEGSFCLALVVLQMVLQACSYKRWVFFGIETWLVKPSVFTLLELQYLMNGRLWLTIEVLRSRGSQFIHRNAHSTERAETKRACRKQRLEAEVLYEHPKKRPRIEEKDSIQKIMEEKSTWELRNTVPFFARRSTSFRRNGRRRFQRSGKLVRLHLVTHAEFPQIFQQLSCSRLRQNARHRGLCLCVTRRVGMYNTICLQP